MPLTIECQSRSDQTNPRAIRRGGRVPATIYGHKGAESTAVTVNTKDAITLLRQAVVNNTLIDVNVTDGDFSGITILREVQYHPYKNDIYHISFFSIASQSKIEVSIPVTFVGVPVGVKVGGGSVEVLMNEIQVSCPPTAIPVSFEVDISKLDVGQGLHVSDIVLPEGVSVTSDGTPLLITIAGGRK
ncbi:ribosomal protein L25, Ctc-form [Synechococcus sp. PCC 7502]|uniref:50S ribosomal protein L25/general stress protein Ctc n=1 Tax=Synechococcus sp. PCC 7502 TaxID=1173263 RepID=UPI00029FBA94|nr:50S ribosomal protein L25/general stress protein Ctc [Synechococcus sp. PCC 7502]AFY75139.1 ribosomal protein L25, Ctc-form [Synechococcus sp. PCC 7502]